MSANTTSCLQVTGKAASVFVVGSALGEMSMPVLTGFLFDKKGPMCLMYVMLAAAIVSCVIYIIMQNLASNKGERYQRLNTLMKLAQNGGDEEETNLDEFANHNGHQSDSPEHNHQNGVHRKRVTFQLPKKGSKRTSRTKLNSYRPLLKKNGKKM